MGLGWNKMEGEFQAQIPGRILPGGIYAIPITYQGEGKFNGCEFEKIKKKKWDVNKYHDEIREQVIDANTSLESLSEEDFETLEELFKKAHTEREKIVLNHTFGEF